jgi:hypothetical protein
MHVGSKLQYSHSHLTICIRYRRGSVIDSLCLFSGKKNIRELYFLNTFEKRAVQQFFRLLRVEFIYRRPRTIKSISEIEWTSASDYWFDTEDGRTNVAVSDISRTIRASITNLDFRNTFYGYSLDLCNTQTCPCLHDLGSMLLSLWSYLTLSPVNSIEVLPPTSSNRR